MDEKDKLISLGRVRVSLPQLLDNMGQSIYITTRMVSDADPNDAYGVFLARLELLENVAVVLRGLCEQLDEDWDGYFVRLPADIGMVVTPNPLYKEDVSKESPEDDPDDNYLIDPFPF